MVQFWFKQCIYLHIFYQWSAISHCHSSLWPWIYVQHSGSASAKGRARWQQASKVHLFDPSKFQASVESILWKPAFVLWPDRREPWPLRWNLGGHWGLGLWRLWLGFGGVQYSSHGAPWDERSYKRGMSTCWKRNHQSERLLLFHGPQFESTGVHSVIVTSYSFPTFSVDVTLGLVQSHCDYWLFFGGLDWSHGMFCRNHDETVRVVNDPLQAWK